MSRPATSQAAIEYTFTDLGTLGGLSSAGVSINASGQVTGNADTPNNASHAFFYDGTMHDIGTFTSGYGSDPSEGYAINDAGQVVGSSADHGYAQYHAFFWDGTLHELPPLGRDYVGQAFGINSIGQITGGGFFYDGVAMRELPTLGGRASIGYGINNAGQITGGSNITLDTDNIQHAFLYDGTVHDLGTLGGTNSVGMTINKNGWIAGQADLAGDMAFHAFLYDGAMHDLGTLGGTSSFADGINASGIVVGEASQPGDIRDHAFLYSNTRGMVDLNLLIDPQSEWELISANGINDSGQITGLAINSDYDYRAFLLSPVPEPGSLALFCVGVAAIVALRRSVGFCGRA
jgi:probable HAF family extracellular repeat protein